ncbi:MAG: SPOR domain-containing protein [Halioglobus sp.]
MNHKDSNDKFPKPEPDDETQSGFDRDSLGDNSRGLEPVFEDFEDFEDEETPESTYEDSGENSFENSLYSAEYEEDTLDYDMDPEALTTQEQEFQPTQEPQEDEIWAIDELKPELAQETESIPRPGLESTERTADKWQTDNPGPWPLGLIAVAVIALLMLGAGGYGVMQQRASMQEEIRSLQAAAATSADSGEMAASRQAQAILEEENSKLRSTIDTLQLEIRSLQDTASGLEMQLFKIQSDVAEQEAVAARSAAKVKKRAAPKPAPSKPKATPEPAAIATAATPSSATAAPTSTGNWFVNFSSYGSVETANSWLNRLKPDSGRVVVAPAEKNGDTYYRVRVIDLKDKAQAQEVARSLEKQYKLPKLWIGEQ